MLERLAVELGDALVRLEMTAHDLDERALPAPFSPSSAWISPSATAKLVRRRLGGAEPLAYAARLQAALQARRRDSWRQVGKVGSRAAVDRADVGGQALGRALEGAVLDLLHRRLVDHEGQHHDLRRDFLPLGDL